MAKKTHASAYEWAMANKRSFRIAGESEYWFVIGDTAFRRYHTYGAACEASGIRDGSMPPVGCLRLKEKDSFSRRLYVEVSAMYSYGQFGWWVGEEAKKQ